MHTCPFAFRIHAIRHYQDGLKVAVEKYGDEMLVERNHKRGMIHADFMPSFCPRWLNHLGGRLPKITCRDKKRKVRVSKIVCKSCVPHWDDLNDRLWRKYKCVDCPRRNTEVFMKITERPPKSCPFTMEQMLALQKF
jgi:hypothetical protein